MELDAIPEGRGMEISGLSSQILYSGLNEPSAGDNGAETLLPEQNRISDVVPNQVVIGNDIEPDPPEKVKGVIRLLQAGHFKGVADVRLRINFFDELNAAEQDAVKAVVADGLPDVLNTVKSDIETLLQSEQLNEDQSLDVQADYETFVQAVDQVKNEFLASDDPSKGNLIAGVASAFEAFIVTLESYLAPALTATGGDKLAPSENAETETAPPVEPYILKGENEPGPEPVSETHNGFQSFLQDLNAAFTDALAEFTLALDQVELLPPLSESQGNGSAYEKFLAIYDQMRGMEPSTLPADQPVDTFV